MSTVRNFATFAPMALLRKLTASLLTPTKRSNTAKILANTPQFVQLICGESGIVPAAFVAILLNCLLPRDEK